MTNELRQKVKVGVCCKRTLRVVIIKSLLCDLSRVILYFKNLLTIHEAKLIEY